MSYSACFTGHRKLLESYYNSDNPTPEWLNLKAYLTTVVYTFVNNGVHSFMSGMAIGVDTVAAEVVGELKTLCPGLTLNAAVPFPSQPSNWPKASKDNHSRILRDLCDNVYNVNDDPYESWKMHARDKFMVDRNDYVIAVWDGRLAGGTYSTVKSAQEQNKQVFRIVPDPLSGGWLENVSV